MNRVRRKPLCPNQARRGFTLVEIMIVVLVVGILSALAAAVIGRIKQRAALTLLQNNLKQLYQAKEHYFTETGAGGPVSVNRLIKEGYLKESMQDRLFGSGALETKMGWHYGRRFVADEPTYAYQGAQPSPGNPPALAEYYPGPPTSFAAVFAGAGTPVAVASSIPKPVAPTAQLPPPGLKSGTAAGAPWVATAPIVLPPVREDTPHAFTQAELLRLTGAVNPGGTGSPVVEQVRVDAAAGTITRQADGTFLFTPAPNFHGSNLNIDITVRNGAGSNVASASVDVTPVVDAARPTLQVEARQQVLTFGQDGSGAVYHAGNLQTGGAMQALAVEFTVLGGPQVASSAGHGATFVSYATAQTPDEFYVWNPGDLTVRVRGTEYATGVNTQVDSASHRYTVLWQGQTGRLQVLKDGVAVFTRDGVAQGATIPGDGKLVLAQDQDSFGGGFAAQDAFHGQYLGATFAKVVPDPARLAANGLGAALKGDPGLIIDVAASAGGFVDLTGRHQIQQQGSIASTSQLVDTSVGSVRPGAMLNLNLNAGGPTDRADRVSGMTMSGLPSGSVLNDRHGHTHTVSGPGERIDVSGWSVGTVTAQLPPGVTGTFRPAVQVVTTGPDGQTAIATSDTTLQVANR